MTQAHALYNPKFSRMVRAVSSFLPLTVPNLERDYFIEEDTLFTAIHTSTDLILLHPFDCLHVFYLSQSLNCHVAVSHGRCLLLPANLRFSKKTLMGKIYALNKRLGKVGDNRLLRFLDDVNM